MATALTGFGSREFVYGACRIVLSKQRFTEHNCSCHGTQGLQWP